MSFLYQHEKIYPIIGINPFYKFRKCEKMGELPDRTGTPARTTLCVAFNKI